MSRRSRRFGSSLSLSLSLTLCTKLERSNLCAPQKRTIASGIGRQTVALSERASESHSHSQCTRQQRKGPTKRTSERVASETAAHIVNATKAFRGRCKVQRRKRRTSELLWRTCALQASGLCARRQNSLARSANENANANACEFCSVLVSRLCASEPGELCQRTSELCDPIEVNRANF